MKIRKEWELEGLGQKIKEARLLHKAKTGRGLKELCEKLGVNRSYWYQMEEEVLKTISVEHLRSIEDLLEVKLVEFPLTEEIK